VPKTIKKARERIIKKSYGEIKKRERRKKE
jgi:hypothetical protein